MEVQAPVSHEFLWTGQADGWPERLPQIRISKYAVPATGGCHSRTLPEPIERSLLVADPFLCHPQTEDQIEVERKKRRFKPARVCHSRPGQDSELTSIAVQQ